MIKMNYRATKIIFISSIFVLSLMFLSIGQVQTEFQNNYTPVISDTFSYSGTTMTLESGIQNRIVTNTTTNELLDYFDQITEQKTLEQITNVSIVIDSITSSNIGTSLSIDGITNTAGSYTKNNTNAYNAETGLWDNSSTTQNLNPSPFNDTQNYGFNYSLGTVPSSMIFGDNTNVYIGMQSIPFGDQNQNQNQSTSCSESDRVYYTIDGAGQISVPMFTNLSQFKLKGIFDSITFNWTEFQLDNLAYIGNHASDNITWANVDIGLISGINPALNGTQVVLVYQLEQNFGTGMLEASDFYCSGGSGDFNPLTYFGDLSTLQLVWTDFQDTNQPFTINGYYYLLTTKTYRATNQTVRDLYVNMSIGDPGSNFYAMVNLSLNLMAYINFVYDVDTGFLVSFSTSFDAKITMSIDSIVIPLGTSGYTGTASMLGNMEAANDMNFNLTSHSSLYQQPQLTTSTSTSTSSSSTSITTSTSGTSSSSSSAGQSTTSTITTDYPAFIFLLALPVIVLLRRKIKS